jgi:riboflavin synthase
MFTGIITEIGKVKKFVANSDGIILDIGCKLILNDINIGDSIAVNGVCLTVVDFNSDGFKTDAVPETLKRTNLKFLNSGSNVNLELALTPSTRIGGHIVSGHIDGMGKLLSKLQDGNAIIFEIGANHEILKYIISKGSVTLDGTSLTVINITDNSFSVSVVPHTSRMSTLSTKTIGAYINIECDIFGKYIEKFLHNNYSQYNSSINNKNPITMDFLMKNGFL